MCQPVPTDSIAAGPAADYLEAPAGDGHLYLITHDQESDDWYYLRRW